MLREGEYVAWFRTALGSGTGRVRLEGGKFLGSDSAIAYAGCYVENGDEFTAVVRTQRHTAGSETLVGADEVEITLQGSSKGEFAYSSGSIAGSPEMRVEVTLFPMRPTEGRKPIYRAEDFHPERLPQIRRR
jgi:hypothetical protein